MKDLRENKDYHHCCIQNAPPVAADIFNKLPTLYDHQLAMVMLVFKNLIL